MTWPRLALTGIALAAVAAAVVVFGAMRPGSNSPESTADPQFVAPSSTSPPASSTVVATVPLATPPTPPPRTIPPEVSPHPWRLGYAGLGPIALGMTLDEATTAAGIAITASTDCEGEASGPPGLLILHRTGRIVKLGIKDAAYHTISGAHLGSTRDDILRTYPHARSGTGDHGAPVVRITNGSGAQLDFYMEGHEDTVSVMSVAANTNDAAYKASCD